MDAHNNPTYLKLVRTAVEEFREAFKGFLTLHSETYGGPGRGIAPAVNPLESVDLKDITAQAQVVAEAAGRARKAPRLTGVLIGVQGHGPVDPIAAWSSVSQPKPILEPENVLIACGQIIGALDDMIWEAEAEMPAAVGPAGMHPLVWGAASAVWKNGHYREAIANASEALIDHVKTVTNRRDVADASIWQNAFSESPPEPGKFRLRWPGDPTDKAVIGMLSGLRQFAPGVHMTVRNSSTHSTETMSEQDALERLGTLSLLARWVDECNRQSV